MVNIDSLKWYHFSPERFELIPSSYSQSYPHWKPNGLWLSLGNEWKSASRFNRDFRSKCIHRTEISISKDANLLVVKTRTDIETISKSLRDCHGVWETIIEGYDGLVILDYDRAKYPRPKDATESLSRFLDDELTWDEVFLRSGYENLWYNTVAVNSACIWNTDLLTAGNRWKYKWGILVKE